MPDEMTEEEWDSFRQEMRRGFYEAWLSRYPRIRDDKELSRRCAAVMAALYDLKHSIPSDRTPTDRELDDADYILTAAKEQIDFVRKMHQPGAWEAALEAALGAMGGAS